PAFRSCKKKLRARIRVAFLFPLMSMGELVVQETIPVHAWGDGPCNAARVPIQHWLCWIRSEHEDRCPRSYICLTALAGEAICLRHIVPSSNQCSQYRVTVSQLTVAAAMLD